MEPLALIIFFNNEKEVLMQLKSKKTKGLFAGQWSLLEGSIINGELSGDLVKGIMEENYFTPSSFKFFKTYPYNDLITKKNYKLFVFTKNIKIPLLKIILYESEQIDYVSLEEIEKLNTPVIIKDIIEEFLS